MNQGLSQNTATVKRFNLSDVEIDRGKRMTAESLEAMEVYKRYEFTEDGVSPFAPLELPVVCL